MKRFVINATTIIAILMAQIFTVIGVAPAYATANNALNFDGVDDYVKTAATLALGGNITYEAWVQTSSTGSWSGIVTSYSPGDPFPVMQVSIHPSGYVDAMVAKPADWYEVDSVGTVNDGQWHHVAVTYATASETFHIYIDGVDQALMVYGHSGPITDLNVNSNLVIGKNHLNGAPFNGAIDQVRAWNVVRTQAQIQANMTNTLTPEAGLMAQYHLDQGTAGSDNTGITTATDSSGNGYDGTLNNFALSGATSNWVSGFTYCDNAGVVTNNADSGAGSLRQAIADACAGGTIPFDASLSGGTIRLASTLTIDKNMTIDGSALDSQVIISGDTDGGGTADVQAFIVGLGVTATLNGLTITEGKANEGGALLNHGTVTIINSTITGNTGLGSGGALRNGSGPSWASAVMTVRNSTLMNNTGGAGGAIANGAGTVTVANSTFYNNSVSGHGGGIYNDGTVTLINNTFSNNSAGIGGGDIRSNNSNLSAVNTIFTNSLAGGSCSGTVVNTGYNIDSGVTCGFGLANGSMSNTNPLLDALAANGGPTLTMPLQAGSPAIDAGDDATCAAAPVNNLDQRGVTRPVGAHCDIGAYEGSIASLAITVLNNNDSGAGSLRQAITDIAADGTITFDSSLSGQTIRLASRLTLSKNVTIDGSALASQVSLSGDSDNSGGATSGDTLVVEVSSGVTATLKNLTITRGSNYGCGSVGGGIENSGNLTINDSNLTYNDASTGCGWDGGAIRSESASTLTVTNSTFTGNKARNGSAILTKGTTVIANSTFTGNQTFNGAGAVATAGSPSTLLANNTFSGNTAPAEYSTDVYNWGGTSTINMKNNILANAITGSNCIGPLVANVNNLIQDGTCSAALSGDPKLDALASNGGPTQTMALQADSPALGAGDDVVCADAPVNGKDQRGVTRPQGNGACDIGAYESSTNSNYTVAFDTDGGSTAPEIQSVAPGGSVTQPSDPTKTGYTFDGWYNGSTAWNFVTDTVSSSMTLTAHWVVNPYTITFNSNGGSDVAPITQDYGTSVSAPAAPTKTGYTFGGWYSDSGLTSAYTFSTMGEDITLFAKWTTNSYTVTFHGNGNTGGSMSDQTNNVTANLTSNAFTKTGYTFAGWDTSPAGTTVVYTDQQSYAFTANADLYAVWTDAAAPKVDSFAATSPINSLNIPITAFTATDNVGVTGYKITTTATPPAAGAAGWSATSPTTFAVASSGTYTLYPWAKDAAGNVSAVFGTPRSVIVDITKPIVTSFTATSPSASLSIPITAFTATDARGVTGYKITTTATPPAAGAAGWTATRPATFAVASAGTYTLYPWAKDAVGNVSAVFGTPRTVVVTSERAINGGFNTYAGVSKIPTSWANTLFAVTDGKDTINKKEGAASVKIEGAAGKTKALVQALPLSGVTGSTLTFSFWVKGTSIPVAGLCQGQVLLYNGGILQLTKTIPCTTGTYAAFQQKALTFNATSAYTKAVIRFTYSKPSGTVWFDAVSLVK